MKYCKSLTIKDEPCKRHVKDDEDVCFQHTNLQVEHSIANFNAKDYYACHLTTYGHLVEILKSKKIMSKEELGKNYISNYEGGDDNKNDASNEMYPDYKKSVFTSVIFPYFDNKGEIKHTFRPHEYSRNTIYLIFKSKIFKNSNHWCKYWAYSEFIPEDCIMYDKKKSLKKNLNSWNDKATNLIEYHFTDRYVGPPPDSIVDDTDISLTNKPKWWGNGHPQYPLLGTPPTEAVFYESISLDDLECIYIDSNYYNKEKMKIMNLYPEYNWVTTNPFE